MANVLQPVVRKPKRSNWYFYIVGAVGIALISGLCYFIFSVDLDPAVYELTAVKQIPISAVQNNRLSDVTQISIIPHSGPESIVYVNGTLYTGTENGNILRIRDSKVEVFHDLKQSDCVGSCGRPLGMRLSKNGENIFIVDASSGVYSLSLENGAVDKIFPLDSLFHPRFLDDLDVLPNGEIVISEATVKYSLQELDKEYFESRANGRLLLVNPQTGQWKVLADGLYFPNGVQLHRDGKSLLVAETTRFRVIRVPLDGKSPATMFVDGLPGFPDNIRLSPRGGYWIPINLLLPGLNMLKTRSSMLLRVDEQGDIIEVWRDPQNKVLNVAEVCEAGEYLYTSSYFLPYVGKVKL
ncbi:Adipocyte plasma membrane-associated protein [Fasciola gigantica]|uniref:Adipocyte plasma membrane-associated protein n=1 Tax=Fasciola gigantica TaxID=46835 RepID=A0A504Z599_FASGI|nr:Adipocyte plasma membrane-associated protein [Fasciola gigantica]